MRMPRTSIDLETCRQPASQPGLRQHSQHRFPHQSFRLGLQQPLSRNLSQPPRVSCMAPVKLLLKLSPGQANLLSVNNNDSFAMVRKRSPVRRVFPDQDPRSAGRQSPQHNPLGINDVPPYSSSFFFLKVCIQFSIIPNFVWVNFTIFAQHHSFCQHCSSLKT